MKAKRVFEREEPTTRPPFRRKIVGQVMPLKANILGIIYMKENGKICINSAKGYNREDDDENDHIVESMDDIKKLFAIFKLKS